MTSTTATRKPIKGTDLFQAPAGSEGNGRIITNADEQPVAVGWLTGTVWTAETMDGTTTFKGSSLSQAVLQLLGAVNLEPLIDAVPVEDAPVDAPVEDEPKSEIDTVLDGVATVTDMDTSTDAEIVTEKAAPTNRLDPANGIRLSKGVLAWMKAKHAKNPVVKQYAEADVADDGSVRIVLTVPQMETMRGFAQTMLDQVEGADKTAARALVKWLDRVIVAAKAA